MWVAHNYRPRPKTARLGPKKLCCGRISAHTIQERLRYLNDRIPFLVALYDAVACALQNHGDWKHLTHHVEAVILFKQSAQLLSSLEDVSLNFLRISRVRLDLSHDVLALALDRQSQLLLKKIRKNLKCLPYLE